jgi:Integral membrane protein TerC family
MDSIGTWYWYTGFAIFVIAAIVIDLLVLESKGARKVSFREALNSNVFAILGLRAMYFMLADLADRFHLLKYGLAFILVFIGIKMLLLDVYKIPIGFALSVVGIVLIVSVVGSLWITRPAISRTPVDKSD